MRALGVYKVSDNMPARKCTIEGELMVGSFPKAEVSD